MMFRQFNLLLVKQFFIYALLLSLCACQDTPSSKQDIAMEANTFLNSNIHFSSLAQCNDINDLLPLWNKRNKIIIYLDSSYCTTCAFKDLKQWKSQYSELKKLNSEIFIICNLSDKQLVNRMKKDAHIDYSLFFDLGNKFMDENKIPRNPIFQTFVIGAANTVVWVGSPIYTRKTWFDFCDMMEALNGKS